MKRSSSIFAVVLLAVFAAPAFAGQAYSAIYVFGDSYCDTGNIWLATGYTQPPSPYYQGRFSDGPLWVDQLAAQFQLSVNPWLGGGTDYAIGGSQLLQTSVIPSIPSEVEAYLYLQGGRADPDALYILEGGINDVLVSSSSSSPAELGYAIAAALVGLEAQLRAAGATHFLVMNVFDVGLLPAAQGNAAFASQASQSADTALTDLLFFEQLLQGASIKTLDAYAFSHDMVNFPGKYGFTDTSTPCLTGDNQECAEPAQRLFWDGYHLTEAGQTRLAAVAETLIHP